ncbi:MAG: peptidoglycan DD-metalloendopeptidase family protein [Fidelibacterota bacterium]
MFRKLILPLSILILSGISSQDYLWPTDASHNLSSNFGEFRKSGYHMGLDIKTNEQEGYPVYAVETGYISRMVANFTGFGRGLYLTTVDGKTAVYGHLSRFSPQLEKRLSQEQAKAKSYIINHYFNDNEYLVKRGDIVGFTGNTGSSTGPHLHFEIRNSEEQPMNPLTNGFKLDDRLSPLMEEISLTPLSAKAWVNGSQLPQIFPLFQDKTGQYNFPDTLNISGPIGYAIKTFDKRQGADNIYQVYRLELWVDNQLVFNLTFDRLDYELMPTANFVKNYRTTRQNLGNFVKLYHLNTEPEGTVFSDSSIGVVELTPGYHRIRIVVQDAVGNIAVADGIVFSMPPFEMVSQLVRQTGKTVTFELQPKTLAIPIENVTCYSFTPYGFADRQVDILKKEKEKLIYRITIPKNQVRNRALQFIGKNKLSARSYPVNWDSNSIFGDPINVQINQKITQTAAGVFIQIQPNRVVKNKILLRLKNPYQYYSIPLNRIQPAVYLTTPLPPSIFIDLRQTEVILKGAIERSIQFNLPYTVAAPDTSITILSKDGLCSILTPKGSVADSTLQWIEAVHKHAPVSGGKLISRVYQLEPFDLPILQPVRVGIRYSNRYRHESNLHLYYYDQDEDWTFIPTKANPSRQVLTGEIKQMDAVAIIQDLTPPKILSMQPGNHGRYESSELKKIIILVDDQLSGIDPEEKSFRLILDDQPLRFAYQPRKKEISYTLDTPLNTGDHSISVIIHDRAGNMANKKITFKIF